MPGLATTVTIESSIEIPGVRAGSVLLNVSGRLLVVGDDAYVVTWIDPVTGRTTQQVLSGDGAPLPKPAKPDLEAAALAADGAIWLFGSGSLPNRREVFRLASDGAVTQHDGAGLHDRLSVQLEEAPNIEGAFLTGEVLRLVHRATGPRPDVLLEIEGFPDRPRVTARHELAPVTIEGVPAHITDAALTADGRVAVLAAAEDTFDAVLDGPVAGTLFGYLGEPWTPIREADGRLSTRKAEGLVLDPDGRSGWLVTDRDDPDLPAELCRFRVS